jgi:hypothetical protein
MCMTYVYVTGDEKARHPVVCCGQVSIRRCYEHRETASMTRRCVTYADELDAQMAGEILGGGGRTVS